jgi:hypothetical protein
MLQLIISLCSPHPFLTSPRYSLHAVNCAQLSLCAHGAKHYAIHVSIFVRIMSLAPPVPIMNGMVCITKSASWASTAPFFWVSLIYINAALDNQSCAYRQQRSTAVPCEEGRAIDCDSEFWPHEACISASHELGLGVRIVQHVGPLHNMVPCSCSVA